MSQDYATTAPTREEVDALPGTSVIEFGTSWCGHCQRAQPHISSVLAQHPDLRHLRVEDGPGRRLGRSFRVKLWPTLVFMRNGEEVARVVRPTDEQVIADALEAADPS